VKCFGTRKFNFVSEFTETKKPCYLDADTENIATIIRNVNQYVFIHDYLNSNAHQQN